MTCSHSRIFTVNLMFIFPFLPQALPPNPTSNQTKQSWDHLRNRKAMHSSNSSTSQLDTWWPTPNASNCRFHATSQFLFQYLTILYATFRKKSWDHENLHFFKNLQCFSTIGWQGPLCPISEAILKNPCGRPWVLVFLLNSDLFFVLAFGMDHSTILDQEKHTPSMNNKHPFDTSIPYARGLCHQKIPSLHHGDSTWPSP